MRHALAAAAALILVLPPAAAAAPGDASLRGPRAVATGVTADLRGSGFAPGADVTLELRRRGTFQRFRRARADSAGRVRFRVRTRRPRRLVLRYPGTRGPRLLRLRVRHVTLASVGDINLGDGVAAVMARRGTRFPWAGVARTLRAADVAFGNLECSVSTRGRAVPKEFNFRGHPGALRPVAGYAGMDVLNLANNHAGDYGTAALLDTVRHVRRHGMSAVGAGGSLRAAGAPRVVERLGLRIAFLGFSDIGPSSFFAGPRRAGTMPASVPAIRRGVRAARRVAHLVVATFHWGAERDTRPSGRQRAFAGAALRAGAAAVIGAHPHVLQPIVRRGHRLTAFSLGNFVWSAGSNITSRTGILRTRLSTRGIEGSRLLPARIVNTQPQLVTRD